MKFKTLRGKIKNIKSSDYLIDWEKMSLSKFQFTVKAFLKPIWERNSVYEEFPVAGTKMRIDIFNYSKMIAIEIMGEQHRTYSEFMSGNRCGFLKQINRDNKKWEWCELNGITLVPIYPEDLKSLTKEWFRTKWNLEI